MKIPVIAVVGPTASGKTSLAVELALKTGGEVISADSMQIYKGMDIATAKPTAEETKGVPHHLIGFADITERFSVADYCRLAHKEIQEINAKGKLPIVCGGTGLYIDSLLGNIDFGNENEDIEKRDEIRKVCENLPGEELLKILASFDKETADRLHPNNRGRIIRAIEVYELTGITQTEANIRSRLNETPYKPIYIGLDFHDREKLYSRINNRVEKMLDLGLCDEAKKYFDACPSSTAAQAIGYKELAPYLTGEMSLDEAVENLSRATRRYAKRQLTWFRRNTDINWIYCDDYSSNDEITAEAYSIICRELE